MIYFVDADKNASFLTQNSDGLSQPILSLSLSLSRLKLKFQMWRIRVFAPIIHWDVKSTNILLDENFQDKLADLGLSRSIPNEGGTHVSTKVVGTPGYLDPEKIFSLLNFEGR